jgi:hypothetical protein
MLTSSERLRKEYKLSKLKNVNDKKYLFHYIIV